MQHEETVQRALNAFARLCAASCCASASTVDVGPWDRPLIRSRHRPAPGTSRFVCSGVGVGAMAKGIPCAWTALHGPGGTDGQLRVQCWLQHP
jgi:hypothetical protein